MRQGNPEPSLTDEEGVETKRQAPSTEGEEIVQPTNPKGAAKAAVGGITAWLLVRIQPGPLLYCAGAQLALSFFRELLRTRISANSQAHS